MQRQCKKDQKKQQQQQQQTTKQKHAIQPIVKSIHSSKIKTLQSI